MHFTLGKIARTIRPDLGKILHPEQYDRLIGVLEGRFKSNLWRHPELSWDRNILPKLQLLYKRGDEILWSMYQMEISGGAIDLVYNKRIAAWVWRDCSAEVPMGRRNIVWDEISEEIIRNKIKTGETIGMHAVLLGNAKTLANDIGMNILTTTDYIKGQQYAKDNSPPGHNFTFDHKSYCWVAPSEARTRHTLPKKLAIGQGAQFGSMGDMEYIESCHPDARLPTIGVRGEIPSKLFDL